MCLFDTGHWLQGHEDILKTFYINCPLWLALAKHSARRSFTVSVSCVDYDSSPSMSYRVSSIILVAVALAVVVTTTTTAGVHAQNGTYSSYDYSSLLAKHPRQYSNSYSSYASPSFASSPIEAIVIGCLAVFGLSLFGIPLLFLMANMFSNNMGAGMGLIPTTTTNVNSGRRRRRRRRSTQSNQFDHLLFSKLIDSFNTFMQSEEKMKLLQRIIS